LQRYESREVVPIKRRFDCLRWIDGEVAGDRAANGHAAAAPPSSVMNVRRLIFALTRSSRRQAA
jgi:hypothetical protein